jgi:hypothetical protein
MRTVNLNQHHNTLQFFNINVTEMKTRKCTHKNDNIQDELKFKIILIQQLQKWYTAKLSFLKTASIALKTYLLNMLTMLIQKIFTV